MAHCVNDVTLKPKNYTTPRDATVDLTGEITRAELLYALESDNHDLRRASTAWYARNYGEEMTIAELTQFVNVDFETV